MKKVLLVAVVIIAILIYMRSTGNPSKQIVENNSVDVVENDVVQQPIVIPTLDPTPQIELENVQELEDVKQNEPDDQNTDIAPSPSAELSVVVDENVVKNVSEDDVNKDKVVTPVVKKVVSAPINKKTKPKTALKKIQKDSQPKGKKVFYSFVKEQTPQNINDVVADDASKKDGSSVLAILAYYTEKKKPEERKKPEKRKPVQTVSKKRYEPLIKTKGHYVGFDILKSDASSQYKYGNGSDPDDKITGSAVGAGLNYKYAFNFNNFFIAPGVFVEKNNYSATDRRAGTIHSETIDIKNRYGLKADVGYDVSDHLAVYLSGGVSNINYKYTLRDANSYKQSGYESGYFYGAGLSYKIIKNIVANLEYNSQSVSFDIEDNVASRAALLLPGDKIDTDLKIIKLGVAYNF